MRARQDLFHHLNRRWPSTIAILDAPAPLRTSHRSAGASVALAALFVTCSSINALADGGAGGVGAGFSEQQAIGKGVAAGESGSGGAYGGEGSGGLGGCRSAVIFMPDFTDYYVGGIGGGGGGGSDGGLGYSIRPASSSPGADGTTGQGSLIDNHLCALGGGGGNGGGPGQSSLGPIENNSAIAGGSGGAGGTGGIGTSSEDDYTYMSGAGGGGGGAGGTGLVVTTGNLVDNAGTIIGGLGGVGGNGGAALPDPFFGETSGNGGSGGDGGDGGGAIRFTTSGATLQNSGSITGGEGGAGGLGGAVSKVGSSYGQPGRAGLQGDGVTGADLAIINSGSISGGRAIVFTGGSNALTMSGNGALTGDIVIASGLLTLAQPTESWTYGTDITGSGAVAIATANGSVISLAGSNSYTGGTTVTAGSTLAIEDSGNIGTGTLALQSLAAVNVSGSGSSFANAITLTGTATVAVDDFATLTGSIGDGTSPGTFAKTGEGLLVLSGASSYSGATLINAGLLEVDGSIAASSLTTVASGAVLQGSGTVGDVVVASGGTFAPGLTPGTSMTVEGDLAFQTGAIYYVEAGRASSTASTVTGTATLAGSVNAVAAPGPTVNQSTILNAAALSGKFASVVGPRGFDASLDYSDTDVTLNLTAALGRNLALSQNHTALATTHDTYFNAGGALPAPFVAVSALSGNALTTTLTQISGETAIGAQHAGIMAATQFVGTLSDMSIAGRGGAVVPAGEGQASSALTAYDRETASDNGVFPQDLQADRRAPQVTMFQPYWSAWGAGYGGTQTADGDGVIGSNSVTSRIAGVALGVDYHLSADTLAGFALATGTTDFTVDGGGQGSSDLLQIGGFLRQSFGSAYLTAAVSYGFQDVTTDRVVALSGEQLHADLNTHAYSARLEAGDRYVLESLGGFGLTPYAAGNLTYLDIPGYSETTVSGPTAFALGYDAEGMTLPRSELGLRIDKSFAFEEARLTLRGRAAWAHDFQTDRSASATFVSLPGARFTVNGAAPAEDAALTSASAELSFDNGITLGATFEGEFSNASRSYAGKGTLRYVW